MKIRELLLCSIDPTQQADAAPQAPPASPAQPEQQMAQVAPAQMAPTPAAAISQKSDRYNALRTENGENHAGTPSVGNYFQQMIGRPPIPLK